MENTTCPRCGSKLINHDVCIKCGEIISKHTPCYLRSIDVSHAKKSYQDQKKYRFKICSNCLRETWNVGNNLCGACKAQVNNPKKNILLVKGSKKYEVALISYREKRWPEQFGNGEVITAATLAQGKTGHPEPAAA